MRVYVGQTRDPAFLTALTAVGIGECTQRGELPPRRRPWFHDNGAFRDHAAGRPFDAVRWLRDQWRIRDRGLAPDFVVCPDVVGDARATYAVSEDLRWDCAEGAPVYFVVQEGHEPNDVASYLHDCRDRPYGGLFVGGAEWSWKAATLPAWRHVATQAGIQLHVGRCGTEAALRVAHGQGADSCDSSFPLWTRERLVAFIGLAALVS